ncbi:MAG: hypothetical protein HUU34_14175 [Saprospiraceae bacterium]|nr:hypothetical protein [Saprospiraceae bacterium]
MKKHLSVFALLFVLTHLFYIQTRHAGFVTDFTGLAARLESSDWTGIFSSFGFPAPHPVLFSFFYFFYKIFGHDGLGWYLVHSTMHAGNAMLLFMVMLRLFRYFRLDNAEWPALAGALFFLLSPNQTEVVVWRVCFNYLLSSALALTTVLGLLRWADRQSSLDLYLALLAFTLGLFTFELTLVVPFICTAIAAVLAAERRQPALLSGALFRLILPQLALVALYFIWTKWSLGVWVGYYGADTHLRFPLADILGNYFRYGLKTLFFVRFMEHPAKEAVFGAFSRPMVLYPALAFVAAALALWIARFRRLSPQWKLAGLMLILFGVALLPVINLYFNYLLHIENDRYGYFASMFAAGMLAALLVMLPRKAFYSVAVVYLIISGVVLHRAVSYWRTGTWLHQSLLADFRWFDRPEVYVLNLPDNYQGAPLFRDFNEGKHALTDALRYVQRKPYEGKLYEVAQYNLAKADDGIRASWADSTKTLVVQFEQYGNWWWRKGIGASDYETDNFVFARNDLQYTLTFKQPDPNAAIIYQKAGKWFVLDKQVVEAPQTIKSSNPQILK